jgi:hypothetical protein
MNNRDCIECGRPLFDQNTPDDSNLCDECYATIESQEENETTLSDDDQMDKPSEIFEGEKCSLKKTFDGAMDKQEEWVDELWVEVMEDYLITAEFGHLAIDQKKHKDEMRHHLGKLIEFIKILRSKDRDTLIERIEAEKCKREHGWSLMAENYNKTLEDVKQIILEVMK